VVEPVVPARAGEAADVAEVRVELGVDVAALVADDGRREVHAGLLAGECLVVPDVLELERGLIGFDESEVPPSPAPPTWRCRRAD
jgi:hypothetical protein